MEDNRHLWLAGLLIMLVCRLHGMDQKWDGRYSFTMITMEQGLPHNYIDDLVKDSEGFLWIATGGGGVARYDSYEFVSFNRQSPPQRRLRDSFAHTLCEDRFKRLWVTCESGIEVIDIQTLQLACINSKDSLWDRLCHQPVHLIYKSEAGNLWMALHNSLYKVTFDEEGDIDRIVERCRLPQRQSIQAVCEINGHLWISCDTGICRMEESGTDPHAKPVKIPMPSDKNISANAFHVRDGELWMAGGDGLYRYDLGTGFLRKYLDGEYVTDVVETDEHVIVASMLTGLGVYDPMTDSFAHIDNSSRPEGNRAEMYGMLNCNFINCMLSDGGLVWIGTEAGGLSRMSRQRLQVRNYVHSDNIAGSIAPNPVNAIYEDKEGLIWTGNVENGLGCLNPKTHTFKHYTTEAPTHLSHNSVSCFTADGDGRLWIGTWGGGFGWLDKRRRFHHIADALYPDMHRGLVCAICYDACNNYVWLTTPHHIYAYDLSRKQLKRMLPDENLGGIAAGYAGCCVDRDSCLWLGLTKGLCRIDLRTVRSSNAKYQLWRNKLDEPASGLQEKISFICQASDGTVWIGSSGYGVYRAQPDKKGVFSFQGFTTQDGLANNAVKAILEDNTGNIWISTINGLSCYDPVARRFHNYNHKDGLVSNLFYWNAACRSRNGDLYFGTIAGLSVVTPGLTSRHKRPVPLKLIDILVSGHGTACPSDELSLHERDKHLQIKFAALDYNPSNSAYYSYRLLGLDTRWTEVDANQRTASYTNLYPGEYVFELRYSPDGKKWMPESASLSITVKPYFYRTVWFKCGSAFLLIACICGLFTWKIHFLKKQRQLLQMKVNERTAELEKQKKLLSVHTEELSRQNILLTRQNERIEQQNAELIQMSRQIQEMTVDKLTFFTNITHEFRTPLTLIVGPIRQALRLSHNPQVIEQLNYVERNSRYLLQLINQLMDFRKAESGNMKIACNPNDLSHLLEMTLPPFSRHAADKGIRLRSLSHLSGNSLLFDEEALHKVLINLISNALKFTPEGGTVTVYAASVSRQTDAETLYIGVRDTGTGIAQEDLEKVFDQFYQSKDKAASHISGQSGTGIGLYICKHLIRLHHGHIWVKNNAAKGCTFRILLPLKQASAIHPSPQPAMTDDQAAAGVPTGSPNRLALLIVEDNQDMRSYIQSILSPFYNVLEASNGKEALDILQYKQVDFIISDLMMPVMDGMELSRQVKANLAISHIPFLMLTAKTSNETRIESFKIGVDEYLLKPFDDRLLLARISNILENRREMQQRFSYDMNVDALCSEEESNDRKFLNRVMQIIKENYKDPDYKIDDFVKAMNISRSVVYRKVQSLTGQPIGNFIRNYRLNIARELILKNRTTQNLNISEIAYEVGFNDPKYFTRCFSKHFNISPSKLMETGAPD